jgi:hypothetical protein
VSCDAAFAEIELAQCVIICASAEIAHCTEYNTRLNGVPIAGTSRQPLQIRSTTSRAITPRPPTYKTKNGLTLSATKYAIHLPVNYLSNSPTGRNCHIKPLPFDFHKKTFLDQKL